jgi:hypothetical protein
MHTQSHRPLILLPLTHIHTHTNPTPQIHTTAPPTSVNYKILGQQVKEYTFTHIFGPTSTQQDLYTRTTQPLVDALYMGKSGLLFAYGVTNAGKTHTILGNEDAPGVLPRALDDIFTRLKRDEESGTGMYVHRHAHTHTHTQAQNGGSAGGKRKAEVVCSYLEVYNDQIFDLLVEDVK